MTKDEKIKEILINEVVEDQKKEDINPLKHNTEK
jgi:hypothetical protein